MSAAAPTAGRPLDRMRARAMSLAAVEKAQRFSAEEVVPMYEALYREALQ